MGTLVLIVAVPTVALVFWAVVGHFTYTYRNQLVAVAVVSVPIGLMPFSSSVCRNHCNFIPPILFPDRKAVYF